MALLCQRSKTNAKREKMMAAEKKAIPMPVDSWGLQKLAAQKKARSWTVMQKAMHRVFFIFLLKNVEKSILPSRQQILTMATIKSSTIIPIHMLTIRANLLIQVYSLRKTGVTKSPVIVSSCHPSFQGFMLLISRQRQLRRQQTKALIYLKQAAIWIASNIFRRTTLRLRTRGSKTKRKSKQVHASWMYQVGSCRQSVPVRVKEELTVESHERQEEKVVLEQVRQGVAQDIAFRCLYIQQCLINAMIQIYQPSLKFCLNPGSLHSFAIQNTFEYFVSAKQPLAKFIPVMSKPKSILTLQHDLIKKQSFGHIKRQIKVGHPKSYKYPQSEEISFVNRCTLIPKHRGKIKTQHQPKYVTVDSDYCFATEVPTLEKQHRVFGKIVNQSRSVSRRKEEENQRDRKDKLGQLYKKKSQLLRNLKLLNSRTRTKTQAFESRVNLGKNSSLVVRKEIKESRSYLIRNARYLGQNGLPKPITNGLYKSQDRTRRSPQSISSVQKNRKVLSFIKKMNTETIKRDLSRSQKYHLDLVQQLKNEFNSLKLNNGIRNGNKKHIAIESTHFDSYFK